PHAGAHGTHIHRGNRAVWNAGELVVAAGFSSQTGPRPENQDFAGIYFGTALERLRHGVGAGIAGGGSGGQEGRGAAELWGRALIEGFYETPDTLGPARAMQAPLQAYNRWLHSQARGEMMTDSATTLTAIALRGRRAHLVHVGDSRAWRYSRER